MSGSKWAFGPLLSASLFSSACVFPIEAEERPEVRGASVSVVAEPAGTEFSGSVEVRLNSSTPADIFYTLDGESPSGPGALRYEGPLTLTDSTLLSFIAVTDLGAWSVPKVELYQPTDEVVAKTQLSARALRLSTKNLFFQAQPGEGSVQQVITVRSVGVQRVRIKEVMIGYNPAGGSFFRPEVFEVLAGEGERWLAPGESLEVLLRYTPTESFSSAALLFDTDADAVDGGLYYVELWGRIFPW